MEEKQHKSNSRTIKEWRMEERPREKMLQKGEQVLTKAELIAILFGNGTQNKSAIDLAKELLMKTNGNLSQLSHLGAKRIMEIKGIGEAKALTLLAALELGRRKQLDALGELKIIRSSKEAFNFLQPIMGDLPHEVFVVIYMNFASKIIYNEQISSGGITATFVDLRIIMRNALQWRATRLILAHNHPSGSLQPSESDKKLTKRIYDAGRILDIEILDHLIITANDYFSFKDNGML